MINDHGNQAANDPQQEQEAQEVERATPVSPEAPGTVISPILDPVNSSQGAIPRTNPVGVHVGSKGVNGRVRTEVGSESIHRPSTATGLISPRNMNSDRHSETLKSFPSESDYGLDPGLRTWVAGDPEAGFPEDFPAQAELPVEEIDPFSSPVPSSHKNVTFSSV